MRIYRFIFILMISLLSMSCDRQPTVLHDAESHVVELSQLKGKWVILNFWAGWCGACLKEIPELDRFYQNNHDHNVLLYGVNFDQVSLEELQFIMRQTNIKFPVLQENPSKIWQLGEINVLPVTFIINPQGNVVKTIYGPNTEKSLLNTLKALQTSV